MNFKRKLKFNNRHKALSVVLFLAALVLFLPQAARADWVTTIVGGLASGIASVLGWILAKVMAVLVYIAQYNNFIHAGAVANGWVIARDISNMFFVVILLVIAFGTILRLENYSYKKWLPKLILMAILINFSKTICGLLIDVAQVVMLTFVNAFKDVMAGGLVDMLGITGWQKLDGFEDVSSWEVAGAFVLSVIYSAIALITVTAMLGMLVMRIIMIWVYVVLSPFAYLLAAFPGGSKYSSMWWSDFTKNLIVGPVLAFFIWLSFTSLVSFNNQSLGIDGSPQDPNKITCQQDESGVCQKGTTDIMIKFVISIAMLLGGMKIAQEIGGAAAGVAGKISSAGNKLAIGAAAGAGLLAWKGVKTPASWANDKFLQEKGIVDLNLKRAWAGMQARRKEKKNDQYVRGLTAAGDRMNKGGFAGAMAMTAGPADAWDRLSDWKGIKPVGIMKQWKGEKKMDVAKEAALLQKSEEEKRFDQNVFENKFIDLNRTQRLQAYDDATLNAEIADDGLVKAKANIDNIDKEIAAEEAKGPYKDKNKIDSLKKDKENEQQAMAEFAAEKEKQIQMMTYAGSHIDHVYDDRDRFQARQRIDESKKNVEDADKKVAANIPKYNRQSRLAEQTAVQKKMGDLRDIEDPTELLRMLKGAIASKDRNMVKAVMLKMSKDGNDNEFLQPLAGRTDHVGLKSLMRDLSDKKSKNYAGFNQQEAFSLGSQIAEINKGTNHWGATSAYSMDNGKWRETTDKEHHEIRDIETGKQQLQAFIRNNNRLAYGYHDEKGDFHLDLGGILKLQSINNGPGMKNIETMNESAAKYVYDAIHKPENAKLLAEFSIVPAGATKSLDQTIAERLGKITVIKNFEEKYNNAKSYLS
ncbi:MAG: hypothetical protein HY931_02680 [Candidatus Falkowbacteria bacterium]|nr:MAG: hypothetical protein HY931_02680 [Candidatus Falkowbacteria bacterium]